MTSLSVSEWKDFLVAEMGAAAALTGLVFVAVSINLSKIMSSPGLPGRAAESLCQFFGVLIVSTALLVPGQPTNAVGLELVVIGALLWAGPVILQVLHVRKNLDQPRSWIVTRVVMSQLATIPFCIAGLSLLFSFPGGLYWMVPGFLFSFVAGLSSAWVLLIEILR